MAGAGSRFFKDGIRIPKPLIDLNGKPFFLRSMESFPSALKIANIIFAVLREHIEQFEIDKVIKAYYPQSQIVVIDKVLDGPVLTVAEIVKGAEFARCPVIINDCDHYFNSTELNSYFVQNETPRADAGVVVFRSKNPSFSYALVEKNRIVQTAEKKVISPFAICGAYYFETPEILKESLVVIAKEKRTSEQFMSMLLNTLISEGRDVRPFEASEHVSFGTPEELAAVLKSGAFDGQ